MSLPSDRWLEVRRRIDDLEARLRRGRFTVPVYLAATVFFLVSGFLTGNWLPATVLAALCLIAAWITHRIRLTRKGQLRTLGELEASLPEEGSAEPERGAAPGKNGPGAADAGAGRGGTPNEGPDPVR